MKYFFVLGRNPTLSKAEIFSYFEKEDISLRGNSLNSNGLIVDVDKEVNLKGMMSELGGTIAVGKVLFSGNVENLKKEIKNKPIYFGRDNKVVYSLLDYAPEEFSSEVLDSMKDNFSKERLKARYKGVSGTIKMQTGEIAHGSPEKIMLRDMNYFLFSDEQNILSFGYLEEGYDSAEAEKKDMEKPYRRESLAISPRLARILVNLSQVRKGGLLLDPFCGIGVIVSEALLKEINVIGVDVDREATESAKKNIEWLKNKYKLGAKSIIINKDSREVRIDKTDGVATEPSLGELMTRYPQREKAHQIISEFENLMIDVLNNVKKGMKRGIKIAFSAPLIKSQSGRVSCNIERICEETGFSVYNLKDITFPIREFRAD